MTRKLAAAVPHNQAPLPTTIWFEAIARLRCVSATYNSTPIVLAPHVLYMRAAQPYVAGVVVERRGIRVEERRIGIFAVAGLREPALLDVAFAIDPAYSADDARWADGKLLEVIDPSDDSRAGA